MLVIPVTLLWSGTITKTFTFPESELRFDKIDGYDVVMLPE
jgi:hypothetical protein